MCRLTALLLLGLAAATPAQNPYTAEGGVRPAAPGSSPVRGSAGGVLDVRPGVERQPTIEVNPTINVTQPFAGSSGMYGLTTAPMYPGFFQQSAMNGYLTGVASVTAATGEYWNQIQQARLTREEARRSSFDTARKRVELEMWYESIKPKTQDLIDNTVRADLERARRDPPQTEIWSGQSLNALMNNILKSPNPTSGPNIPLSQDTLRGLNLVDRSSRGNLSMAKDEGRIAWPESLQEETFDGPRERFSKLFAQSISAINAGDAPDIKALREMRKELRDMTETLEGQVSSISPAGFLSGRRVLNQLRDQVAGMSNPAVLSVNRGWRTEVQTVADLVGVFKKQGLTFGPAVAPGDERAYNVVFFALRNYERSLAQLASR
ncbi:MAG: hypothetical protein ACRC33_11135 [Gemmataceae bacterium]